MPSLGSILTVIFVSLVGVFTLTATVSDARSKRLPNQLTVAGFGLGILFHLFSGALDSGLSGAIGGWREGGLLFALAGFGTGFGILFVLWLIGGGGGGDVKLMGAVGAWMGAVLTLQVFLVATVFAIIGAAATVVMQTSRLGFMGFQKKHLGSEKSKKSKRQTRKTPETMAARRLLPFGVPVALASWSVLAFHLIRQG